MSSVGKEIHIVGTGARIARSLSEDRSLACGVRVETTPSDSLERESGSADSESSRIGKGGITGNRGTSLIGGRSEYARTGIGRVRNAVVIQIGIFRNDNDELGDRSASFGIRDDESDRIIPHRSVGMSGVGERGNGAVAEIPTVRIRADASGNDGRELGHGGGR